MVFLEILQNSQENTYARLFFNKVKKESLAQVFSYDFCKNSKNTSGRLLLGYESNIICSEVAWRSFKKKIFWKYEANLQESTHVEVWLF